MNGEEFDLNDDIQSIRQGYERYLDDELIDDINDAAVVSVRRQHEITTLFGPNSKQNRIKISLSQEQIVKRTNGVSSNGVKRSQSVNERKTLSATGQGSSRNLYRGQSIDVQHQTLLLRRPSLIPIKINDHSSSSRMYSSLVLPERQIHRRPVEMYKSELPPTTVRESNKAKTARQFSVRNSDLHSFADNRNQTTTSLSYIRNEDGLQSDTFGALVRKTSALDDKFKCQICHNTLNDPRVLDCLHTFCLECLFEIEQSGAKANTTKVSVSMASNSREDSEIDTSGSSPKNDGSETGIVEFGGKCDQSNRKSRKSANGVISSSHLKKIFSVAMKNKSDEQHRTCIDSNNSGRNIRYSKDASHVASTTKRRLSTVTEKNKTIIKCPICAYRTEIAIGGVTRVPKNFLLERQLQDELNSREHQNLADKLCSLCYDDIEAVVHCSICRINLCEICKEAHLRQRTTSRHNLETLPDGVNQLQQNEKPSQLNRMPLKCFIHPTQELKLYCTTCDQVACHNCTILLHKCHKYAPIFKASKYSLKCVKESLERNRKFCEYVGDSISKLTISVKKIDQRADVIQNEIEQFLNDYFEALEAHKKTLLRQIAKAKESKHASILEQQEYLEKRANEAKQANVFAENLLMNGSELEILTFIGTLQRRFDHCQKSKSSIDPKIPDGFRFLPELRAPATQAQHNIPMYGIIATQLPDPKCCILDIREPIVLRVHRRAELRMISKDCDDRPLCHGGITLLVEVKYKEGTTKDIVATQISDKRDGTYLIIFTPDSVGVILLTVRVQDKDIKGSPYAICVRALRPHSGIFHCCTFCSSKGSKSMTCACNSKMTGGYNGCGHGHDGHPGKRHWSCCANVLESSECSATNSFH